MRANRKRRLGKKVEHLEIRITVDEKTRKVISCVPPQLAKVLASFGPFLIVPTVYDTRTGAAVPVKIESKSIVTARAVPRLIVTP